MEHYLSERFDEDEDAKRMQRSEIVLKKFGLLDRDFNLKPFLLALLKEQIEAYYDSKTKTVNMLDWISVDEQKPVLATNSCTPCRTSISISKSGATSRPPMSR